MRQDNAGTACGVRNRRFGIHWEEIDQNVELAGLLVGARAPDAKASVEA
jgi:hypothetical protein